MAEAAMTLPAAILAAMLLLRMFVFYLEILTEGIKDHREALEAQNSYKGAAIHIYEKNREISLLSGGLLERTAYKRLETEAYLINEDILARSGEVLN